MIYKKPGYNFLLRWFVCSLGLWISAALLSSSITFSSQFGVIVISGFILALINTVLKPFLVFLSIPALLLSLGLFMLIINGFTVYLVSKLYHSLHITNFWAAVFAGMVIGLVNYLVTAIVEDATNP
ncbi:MAG: phage holin family protein [Candidatus Saccharimonadales bacterium]